MHYYTLQKMKKVNLEKSNTVPQNESRPRCSKCGAIDAEYQRLHSQLDPKDPQFGNKVHELFLAADIDRTGCLKKKIALLTYLVENELAPALPGAIKFHPEPLQMFSLVSIYMDDPQAIKLLPTVLEYELTKYPNDQMVMAQAEAFGAPILVMLEMDRNDPAEAEKSWQSGRELQPETQSERENAHRLFRLVEMKAKRKHRVNVCTHAMEKVSLFYLERPDIKISMQLYFNEKNQLYFDGYDTGKFLEKTFGDSDYEYIYTIEPEDVHKFYPVFNLKDGDKSGLLQAIKKKFSVNEAYSLFGKFMLEHNIKHQRFIWH